jgi:hypothetical protein
MAEPALNGMDVVTRSWRGIDELGGLIGAYCWLENRIFEICGVWATAPGHAGGEDLDPALRVWCAGVSRRHGELAVRWAERLPLRAGVDRAALVSAPAGPLPAAFDGVGAGPDARIGVATLVGTVLPRLQGVYGAHHRSASPVSEAPVLEVLVGAHRDLAGEIRRGGALLERSGEGMTRDAALGAEIERALSETGVFPAVPAS